MNLSFKKDSSDMAVLGLCVTCVIIVIFALALYLTYDAWMQERLRLKVLHSQLQGRIEMLEEAEKMGNRAFNESVQTESYMLTEHREQKRRLNALNKRLDMLDDIVIKLEGRMARINEEPK